LVVLVEGVFWVAIVALLGVWDSTSLSIDESESLIEVWAMLKRSDV